MVVVPAATPVAVPVAEPMFATVVVPLVQVPDEVASVNVVVPVPHTLSVPPIAAGFAFTVTGAVLLHPVGNL